MIAPSEARGESARAKTKAEIYGDAANPPAVDPPDFTSVPVEMRAEPRWMLWRLKWRDGANGKPGKWTKPPAQPDGTPADSTDPAMWSDIVRVESALDASAWAAGAGFALGDGWVGLDLDNVRNPITGEMTPEAAALVARIGTYAEASPSGSGLKMIGRGSWCGLKNRYPLGTGELEIYGSKRYFTVTGKAVGRFPVIDIGPALNDLAKELDAKEPDATANGKPKSEVIVSPLQMGAKGLTAADFALLARAGAAANGAKLLALFNGDTDGYPSGSEADLSLCSCLAFWTGAVPERIDRLFRSSRLYRPKWGEMHGAQTYGAMTIAKALADRVEYHSSVNAGEETDAKPVRFPFVDSAALDVGDYRPEWLVTGVLVKGQPGVVAGPSKALKTNLSIDLAVSLATGGQFVGKFGAPKPVRVAVVSGESGKHTLQETARRVCAAKGVALATLADRLHWCFDLPTFSQRDVMAEFGASLAAIGADVVIIDPLYLALGDVDAKNLFEAGAAFRVVAEVLLGAGCTPLLVHHANRQLPIGGPMELTHLAYSGLEQFARQWMLLNRRTPFAGDGTHDLWLGVGGSAGQGGLMGLHIEEGVTGDDFGGRTWSVEVQSIDAVRRDAGADREAAKLNRERAADVAIIEKVCSVVQHLQKTHPDGVTRSEVMENAKLGQKRVENALGYLVESGRVVAREGVREAGKGAKRKATVYALAGSVAPITG